MCDPHTESWVTFIPSGSAVIVDGTGYVVREMARSGRTYWLQPGTGSPSAFSKRKVERQNPARTEVFSPLAKRLGTLAGLGLDVRLVDDGEGTPAERYILHALSSGLEPATLDEIIRDAPPGFRGEVREAFWSLEDQGVICLDSQRRVSLTSACAVG